METRHETLIEKNYEAKKKLKKYVFHIFLNLITELSVNKTKKRINIKIA